MYFVISTNTGYVWQLQPRINEYFPLPHSSAFLCLYLLILSLIFFNLAKCYKNINFFFHIIDCKYCTYRITKQKKKKFSCKSTKKKKRNKKIDFYEWVLKMFSASPRMNSEKQKLFYMGREQKRSISPNGVGVKDNILMFWRFFSKFLS